MLCTAAINTSNNTSNSPTVPNSSSVHVLVNKV